MPVCLLAPIGRRQPLSVIIGLLDSGMALSLALLVAPARAQMEPQTDIERTTVSVNYHQALHGAQWATTLAVGRNDKSDGPSTDALLLESTWIRERQTLFARFERTEKDELFEPGEPLARRAFTINKLSVGAIYDLFVTATGRLGIGAEYGRHFIPGALEPVYGNQPDAWLVFARWRL